MNDPVKLIYKYKNLNKRNQYELFIFLGNSIDAEIKKILLKIKNLNFYDTIMELSLKEIEKLIKRYGNKWFLKLFLREHLELSFNLIQKTPQKHKDIEKKFGKKWIDNNIILNFSSEKTMYSYEYFFKRERELRERNNSLREKQINHKLIDHKLIDYSTRNLQIGGDEEDDMIVDDGYPDEYNLENSDNLQIGGDEEDEIIADDGDQDDGDQDEDNFENSDNPIFLNKEDLGDIDEFDLEELENMYHSSEIDENVESTSKLIDKIMKNDEKNITSKNKLIDFPDSKNNVMYDDTIKNVFIKNYIFEQYIFKDDTIKKIKEKICCSIKLNKIFEISGDIKHNAYLTPSRTYMWSKYSFIDQEDNKKKQNKIMLGQKWIERTQMLKIDIEPEDNLKIYEELRGSLRFLKQDMRKYGSRIRREEDEFKLLEDYDDYIENNEIYITDIFNELGLNYSLSIDKLKNLYDIYIKIYFFHINTDDFKQIINYLNVKDEQNRKYEINHMKNVFQTINNELNICLNLKH